MNKTIELQPYTPDDLYPAAQVVREIITTPPLALTESLSDILSQLQSDQTRPGFGGVVCKGQAGVMGVVWWFEMNGRELYDRWRPRFAPKDQIPNPPGKGMYLPFLGVLGSFRGRGLGNRLLAHALAQIEPGHDWIASLSHRMVNNDLWTENGFEILPLTGIQSPDRLTLFKRLTGG